MINALALRTLFWVGEGLFLLCLVGVHLVYLASIAGDEESLWVCVLALLSWAAIFWRSLAGALSVPPSVAGGWLAGSRRVHFWSLLPRYSVD